MYPKHMGHENGGCGHLGRAPLSPPTFGGHSCKKDCMVAPHESRLIHVLSAKVFYNGVLYEPPLVRAYYRSLNA